MTKSLGRAQPMGECAVLIDTDDTDHTLALAAALQRDPLPHQQDVVPGAETVLISFTRPVAAAAAARALASRQIDAADTDSGDEVTIDVDYDGADLAAVADLTGLSSESIVTYHTETSWRVAFCGFSPGFGYLVPTREAEAGEALSVPRRDTPRTEVPAGSVGLAGEYSGVYPAASPGGWQLIGRTDAALWDLDRDPPAMLRPGMTVRFRACRPSTTTSSDSPSAGRGAISSDRPRFGHEAGAGRASLRVIKPGMQCTVQDLGRPGLAGLGVSPSGAADRGSALRGNQLVGNAADAAVLEILFGGAEFEATSGITIAVTGAAAAVSIEPEPVDDAADRHGATDQHGAGPVGMDRPIAVPAGARVSLGRPQRGLRTYLAVRGGIDTPPVLGSRSTDLLAGVGPPALQSGDVVSVGRHPAMAEHPSARTGIRTTQQCGDADPIPTSSTSVRSRSREIGEVLELVILPGPQLGYFASDALGKLCAAEWTVSPASSRVGVRLNGPTPERTVISEVPSQGVVRGAIQVPPSGELVIFGPDHPVTGGYPVIAVVSEQSADLAAQARPGTRVRFRLAQ